MKLYKIAIANILILIAVVLCIKIYSLHCTIAFFGDEISRIKSKILLTKKSFSAPVLPVAQLSPGSYCQSTPRLKLNILDNNRWKIPLNFNRADFGTYYIDGEFVVFYSEVEHLSFRMKIYSLNQNNKILKLSSSFNFIFSSENCQVSNG